MHPDVELTMKLSSQDLKNIEVLTLQHYNERAEEFSRGTRDHAVSQNIAALLQYIEGKLPSTILDFGCGPGRDLKAFAELTHYYRPVGLPREQQPWLASVWRR